MDVNEDAEQVKGLLVESGDSGESLGDIRHHSSPSLYPRTIALSLIACAALSAVSITIFHSVSNGQGARNATEPPLTNEMGVITTGGMRAIIKPANDHREYLGFILPNQLEALVISDPDADKAAAALSVGSGSLDEGTEINGLAHFCEHMLFLGTSEFPREEEYSTFISQHGGSDNAYTGMTETNFFFDIDSASLEPALRRFASFFKSPLLSASGAEREMQAVDSEFHNDILIDDWRSYQLTKCQADPSHPYSQFSIGSLETLNKSHIHSKLLDYYNSHYSASEMKLVVIGKEPVGKLRSMAANLFNPVRSFPVVHEARRANAEVATYPKSRLGRVIWQKAVKDHDNLIITWPVFPTQDKPRLDTIDFVGNVLGDEQDGSALAVLKGRGWAQGLSFGMSEKLPDTNLLQLSVRLTAKGLEHASAVVQILFQAVRLIQRSGVTKSRWKDGVKVAAVNFRFSAKKEPFDEVSQLASRMHDVPAGPDLLYPPGRTQWNATRIHMLLNLLTPSNALYILRSQSFPTAKTVDNAIQPPPKVMVGVSFGVPANVLLDKSERWFSTPFAISEVGVDASAYWSHDDPAVASQLRLPPENPFVPDEETGVFEILPLQQLGELSPSAIVPERIHCANKFDNASFEASKPGFQCGNAAEVWWGRGELRFGMPKVHARCLLPSLHVFSSAAESAYSLLWTAAVADGLNSDSYAASLAGFEYSLDLESDGPVLGVGLDVGGYLGNDADLAADTRYEVWLDRLVRGLRSPAAIYADDWSQRFDRILENVQQVVRNSMKDPPYKDTFLYHALLTRLVKWAPQDLLPHLRNATHSLLRDHALKLFPSIPSTGPQPAMGLQCLFYGNLERHTALRLSSRLASGLGVQPLERSKWPAQRFLHMSQPSPERPRVVDLSNSGKTCAPWTQCSNALNSEDVNSASLVSYYIRAQSACVLPMDTIHWDARSVDSIATMPVNKTCALPTAQMMLLEALAQQPAFDQLRTKEQLGYIVSLFASVDGTGDIGARWLSVLVQGGEHGAEYITQRVHAFLRQFASKLSNISSSELQATKRATRNDLLTKDVTLSDAVGRIWNEIVSGAFRFRRRDESAAAIELVTLPELQAFYEKTILDCGPGGSMSLEFKVFGKGRQFNSSSSACVLTPTEQSRRAFQEVQNLHIT